MAGRADALVGGAMHLVHTVTVEMLVIVETDKLV